MKINQQEVLSKVKDSGKSLITGLALMVISGVIVVIAIGFVSGPAKAETYINPVPQAQADYDAYIEQRNVTDCIKLKALSVTKLDAKAHGVEVQTSDWNNVANQASAQCGENKTFQAAK